MATVYLGLGSNLAAPIAQIEQAMISIAAIENTHVIGVSSLYGSKPMGPQDQPDYINAVLALNTTLTPLQLLDALQAIELSAGRVRKNERWAARVLDLDILLFDQQVIDSPRLTVPHYGMKTREFVLYPLAELTQYVTPAFVLPCGIQLSTLLADIPKNGLVIKSKVNLATLLG